jgi:hypothetical protein
VRPDDLHPGGLGEASQAAGGGVAVHPGAVAVEQDRSASAGADCPVDGPPDRRRQRDQDDLGAFAAYAQYPVAMLFAEVGWIGPQPASGDMGGLRPLGFLIWVWLSLLPVP